MKVNAALSVVAGALLLLGLSANAWAQDVVKIAAGAPLTGPLAKMGQEVANAIKRAADEWSAKGGMLGAGFEQVKTIVVK